MEFLPTYLLIGLFTGGIYSLIALGVVVVYKATKVFNFAVGELVMIGGCVATSILGTGLPWWLGIILTAVALGLVGMLIQRGIMTRFLGKSVLSAMLATCILIYFLSGMEIVGWTGRPQGFPVRFLPEGAVEVWGGIVSIDLAWSFVISIALFGILVWFFQATKIGLGMRAVAEDNRTAQSKGVSLRRMHMVAWIIAGITAALGGIFLGYRIGINPSLSVIGLKAFPIVFLGGLESFPGAILGGVIIGLAETLGGGYLGSEWIEVIPFIILVLVLALRPEGLLGVRRVERI